MATSGPSSIRANLIGFGGFSQLACLGFTNEYDALLARNLGSGELAAIRRLRSFPEPTTLRRLLSETNRLTGFEHPNVLPVVGAWVDDCAVWCATEYLPGSTFAELSSHASARGEQLATKSVVRILLEASRGLAAVRAFDPCRISTPMLADDIWIGEDGKSRFVPLAGIPNERRVQLRALAPSRGAEVARDVFFLGCLWWEALSGTAVDADTLARPTCTRIPEALQQLLVGALTCPDEFPSGAEFLVLALSAGEGAMYIASSREVANLVHTARARVSPTRSSDLRQSGVRSRADFAPPYSHEPRKATGAARRTLTPVNKRPRAPTLLNAEAGSIVHAEHEDSIKSETTPLTDALMRWAETWPDPTPSI
jgi:hypothetical protein